MPARRQVRDALAALSRKMPAFRGKARTGAWLSDFLTDFQDERASIVVVRMRHGGYLKLDLRSRTERWPFWTGQYDQRTIEKLASYIGPGSIVLDVGANIGFYSIALGLLLKQQGGRLFAFEPVKSNYDRLVDNIERNELQDVVHPIQVALGAEEGKATITVEHTDGATTGNAVMRVHQGGPGHRNEEIRVCTLDEIAEELGITSCDVIKVDVEGAEYLFLYGGAAFIQKNKPVIYGEFNPYWIRQFGYSLRDVAALTDPWGYRLYREMDGQVFELDRAAVDVENILMLA